jgi:3-dehydroquinate dehydratase
MAMGPLGKSARLLLSACGSALTYGYLHRPIASGQWDAATLKRRLAEAVS